MFPVIARRDRARDGRGEREGERRAEARGDVEYAPREALRARVERDADLQVPDRVRDVRPGDREHDQERALPVGRVRVDEDEYQWGGLRVWG